MIDATDVDDFRPLARCLITLEVLAAKAEVERAIAREQFPNDPVMKALAVLTLTPETQAWLHANDPLALAQAWRVMATRIRMGG